MKILIVDDERAIRNSLSEILSDEGYNVEVAEDGPTAIEMAEKERYDVIFCDIKMPNMEGTEVLEKLRKDGIDSAIIMISGHGDIETAVECIKKGAFDFIQKPLDLNRILITIKNATERTQIITENTNLKKKVFGQQMIGESAPIKHLKEMIEKVAPTDARVLITGPNGSGKELVARSLHQQSNRSAMPYIEVNCAAIPSELIESELFGHEKGAFTDAREAKEGRAEQADDGTLFLDEIGNLSLQMQQKMLTLIEKRETSRIGSSKKKKVDVRIISATNADLAARISEGTFRQDLFYRINTIELHIPPLRERGNDIILLAEHFLSIFAMRYDRKGVSLSDDARTKLLNHSWPGNVRELQHSIERSLVLCSSPTLSAADIQITPNTQSAGYEDTQQTLNLEELERNAIKRAVSMSNGNLTQAAELLGITRFALYRKIDKLGI